MTPNNSDGRTIACVVDTECCYKNAKPYDEANGLVYHFGAVFGDINQQQYSISYKEMDYYARGARACTRHTKQVKNPESASLLQVFSGGVYWEYLSCLAVAFSSSLFHGYFDDGKFGFK